MVNYYKQSPGILSRGFAKKIFYLLTFLPVFNTYRVAIHALAAIYAAG